MQELESSQRQIDEQRHHKVPSCWPTNRPAWEGPRTKRALVSPRARYLTNPHWSVRSRCIASHGKKNQAPAQGTEWAAETWDPVKDSAEGFVIPQSG